MKYVLVLLTLFFSTQSFAGETISAQTIADGVHVFSGNGGNIMVITGEDGVVIVDDQFLDVSDEIRAKISDLGGGEIKFVLNTHWHQDHTGGNAAFGGSAVIISHANVRKRLETDQFIEFFNKTVEASPKHALPIVVFDQSISLYFNNHEITVRHLLAGHTDGDSYVYLNDANILHTGDQFFNGKFPFIDIEHGGDINGYIRNVQQLIDLCDGDTIVIPGHGPVGDRKSLQVFHEMLTDTSNFVANEIKSGTPLKLIQEKGFGGKWDSWGKGFLSEEKWISILYNGLS